jgi:heme-degrading monooxygenase HmoA
MFSIIYKFEIKPERKESFEKSWKNLTLLIYKYAGSLGSRLHKKDEYNYIAYAQWPNKETWENSSNKLPEKSKEISRLMKESCISIETEYKLDLIEDLLENKPSHNIP